MAEACRFHQCGRPQLSDGLCEAHLAQKESGERLTPLENKHVNNASFHQQVVGDVTIPEESRQKARRLLERTDNLDVLEPLGL